MQPNDDRSLVVLGALGTIGFALTILLLNGCASGVDTARRGLTAAYQVAATARAAVDAYDANTQQKIIADMGNTLASVQKAKADFIAYKATRDKIVGAIDLLYATIGSAQVAIAAVEAKQVGAEATLNAQLALLLQQALDVKTALGTLGINIGGAQ